MSRNAELAQQIDDRVASLTLEVETAESVIVRIPEWAPVDLNKGLHWLRASLAEGFYVGSRVTWSGREATIWMKLWEYGEPEPQWDL